MVQIFNKLVRDNIPNIIENNGEKAITRILSDKEYRVELYKKLLEESQEVINSQDTEDILEELADVLEVLKSIAELENRNLDDIIEIAENRARRHIPMTMEDWANRIDKFLLADDRDILKDAGKISHEIARDKALTEFEKYRIKQDKLYKSDFDLLLEDSIKMEEEE